MIMSKKSFVLPQLSDNKEYAAASAKLAELRLQLTEAQGKRDEILNDINKERPQRNLVQEAAEKMLGGSNPEIADQTKLQESLEEVITRIAVIGTAIQLQEKIVMDKKSAASFEVVERLQPVHHENVRKVVAKLKELDEALTAEADLREGLYLAGFAAGRLTPMCILELGFLRDVDSRVSYYLIEACREGFIARSELPENMQNMVPPPEPKNPVSKALKARLDALTATA